MKDFDKDFNKSFKRIGVTFWLVFIFNTLLTIGIVGAILFGAYKMLQHFGIL